MPTITTKTTPLNDGPGTILRAVHLVRQPALLDGAGKPGGRWLTRTAIGLAGTRTLLGCIALAIPETAGRAWIGPGASGRDRAVLVRALAGRDVALGLGALLALRSRHDVRRWLLMGAASDLVDTAGSAAGFASLPHKRRWAVLAASAGAACAGAALAANMSSKA